MTNIREEDFEIESPKEEKKKVPIYTPKKEEKVEKKEEKKEVYIEKMNKVYEPNGMKLIDKDDFNNMLDAFKKKTIMNWIFGAIATILLVLLVVNLFWFNASIKDGKFQSSINTPVNIDNIVNASCNPITYNNITNINNIYNNVQTCNQTPIYLNQSFSNVVLTNVTIYNSTINSSNIINTNITNSTIQ